jgi:phosphoribosylanthranilate isomerase
MIDVKICGVRTPAEADDVAAAGADLIGLVFVPGSKRRLDQDRALACRHAIGSRACVVGVFLDQPLSEVRAWADGLRLDLVQLHGSEPPDFATAVGRPVLKRLTLGELHRIETFPDCRILLDPGAGDGRAPDWRTLAPLPSRVMIAGGLTPETVAATIAVTRPTGVDVSSGVERNGAKAPDLVRRFLAEARGFPNGTAT